MAKSDSNEQTSKDVQSSNLSADSDLARPGQDYAEAEHSRILEVATTSPDLDQNSKPISLICNHKLVIIPRPDDPGLPGNFP